MRLILQVEVEYLPWHDWPSHGGHHHALTMVSRLCELARRTGFVYHFVVRAKTRRAVPTLPPLILSEGHALDVWEREPEAWQEGKQLLAKVGHLPPLGPGEFLANSVSSWTKDAAGGLSSHAAEDLVLKVPTSDLWKLDPHLSGLESVVYELLRRGFVNRTHVGH